jgi:uncharacterized membrane protein
VSPVTGAQDALAARARLENDAQLVAAIGKVGLDSLQPAQQCVVVVVVVVVIVRPPVLIMRCSISRY